MLLISLIMDKVLGKESMGGGDIKLFAVVGLYLGFAGTLFFFFGSLRIFGKKTQSFVNALVHFTSGLFGECNRKYF